MEEDLIEQIKEYSIILDDYINKRFKYTLNTDYLEEEIIDSKYATMNIGVINGGRNINIVADNCQILIDFRTICKDQNERIIKKIDMSDFITEASFIELGNKYILGVGPVNAHKKMNL